MKTPIRGPFVLALCLASLCPADAATTAVEAGGKTEWRYLDNDQRPPANWFQPAFDDRAWPAGRAPLGFGEPDIATPVRSGPDPKVKAPTTYFRHTFTLPAVDGFQKAVVALRVDDGARVFLNGREVGRVNLPRGTINHATTTPAAIGGEDEYIYHTLNVPVGHLVAGANVLAVEVHQCNAISTDLFLDLQLKLYAGGEEPEPEDTPIAGGDPKDPIVGGLLALRQGQLTRAVELLGGAPETHPRFQAAMLQAGEALADTHNRPDLAAPLVDRAYRKSPDNAAVLRSWLRAQLLARQNLIAPLAPRAHPSTIPEQWRWIVAGPHYPDRSKKFPRAQLEADLDSFETIVANAFSYADRRGADWRGALDALRASLDEQTGLMTFGFRFTRLLALFGDPHANAKATIPYAGPRGMLPFMAVPLGSSRVLAVAYDRSSFVDAAHPYVKAIDGRPIEDFVRVAGWDVAQGSPHYHWNRAVHNLHWLDYVRGEMELPLTPKVRITLSSEDGASTVEQTLAVTAASPRTSRLPGDTHFIRDGVGYLRIASMLSDEKFIAGLDRAMQEFRGTHGLVIDLRGNGGGYRDSLITLLPYLLPPGGPLRIVNVGAYRIPVKLARTPLEGFHSGSPGLRPLTSTSWTERDRAVIRTFFATFTPDWKPPTGVFSEWAVMGLRHETNPRAYPYEQPVIVLSDAGCVSATDHFLGAVKGLPRVTILGTTSAGGSGRMSDFILPHTKIPFTISQAHYYQPNGKLFEGAGVEPDIVMDAKPTDHLIGGGDSVLEAAFTRLNASRRPRRRPPVRRRPQLPSPSSA